MSSASRELTLFVPGLLGPVSFYEELPAQEKPSLPAFLKLLSVSIPSEGAPGDDYYEGLFELFQVASKNTELPVAPISYRMDAESATDKYVLLAHPVHLRPDRDQLVMLANDELSLSMEETNALVAEINQFFDEHEPERGWQLKALTPERWYLFCDKPQQLHTIPIYKTLGYSIQDAMPKGKDASAWLAIINEIQMLLHASPINQRRMAQGQLTINSLWLSGGGDNTSYQYDEATAYWDKVFTDDFLVMALARLSGTARRDKPEDSQELLANDFQRGLVVIQELLKAQHMNDIISWVSLHQQLEQYFWQPLLKALKNRQLDKLTIQCEHRVFVITPQSLWKFWKKLRPLGDYLLSR